MLAYLDKTTKVAWAQQVGVRYHIISSEMESTCVQLKITPGVGPRVCIQKIARQNHLIKTMRQDMFWGKALIRIILEKNRKCWKMEKYGMAMTRGDHPPKVRQATKKPKRDPELR